MSAEQNDKTVLEHLNVLLKYMHVGNYQEFSFDNKTYKVERIE